ncbi:MAG: G5 domain-containing protein [Clostridia bacterium]|nr:G5 domain-containing protein [Clostridia bacterium]
MLQKMKSFAADVAKPSYEVIVKRTFQIISYLLVIALVFAAFIGAVHTVRVNDGKSTFVTTTIFKTPVSIAERVADGSEYEVKSVSKGLYSTDVVISYYFPITVTIGDKSESYTVASGKLGDILRELNIKVDSFDIVNPSLDTEITESCVVDIADVEFKTETHSEEIPFGSVVEYSDKYYATTQKVQKGHNGSKVVTSSVMYINGVAASSTVIGEEIVTPAVDTKTVIGTRAPKYASSASSISTLDTPNGLLLDDNGLPIKYKSVKTLKATAYTHTGNRCSTGVWPEPGYVAVDPKEIPYGTKMYIVSSDGRYNYGYAIAADTGGFIHTSSTDIDLFMNTRSQCINFGRRDITVYFLD